MSCVPHWSGLSEKQRVQSGIGSGRLLRKVWPGGGQGASVHTRITLGSVLGRGGSVKCRFPVLPAEILIQGEAQDLTFLLFNFFRF